MRHAARLALATNPAKLIRLNLQALKEVESAQYQRSAAAWQRSALRLLTPHASNQLASLRSDRLSQLNAMITTELPTYASGSPEILEHLPSG